MPNNSFKKYLFVALIAVLILPSCEDGIKFPWSNEKAHEAEVTADTLGVNQDSTAVVASDSLSSSNDSLEAVPEPVNNSPKISEVKQWRVVVSSMPSEGRAQKFIKKHELNEADILFVEKLNTYRVVHSSFEVLADAQVEYSLIRSQFPEAWLVYF